MSGYLEVKYPFKSNLGLNPFKTWKRQWCILRPSPTCTGGGSLAVYCSEAGASAGAVELPPDSVVRRAKSRSRPHAFAVFSVLEPHKPRILLAAQTFQDAQLWMDKIRALLDGKQLLGSELLSDSYSVTIISTELSRKLALTGDGQLSLSGDGVLITRSQTLGTLIPWKYVREATHSTDSVKNKICAIRVHSGFHSGGSLRLSSPLAGAVAAALAREAESRARGSKRLSKSEGDLRAAASDGDLGEVRRSSWSSGARDDTDLLMLKESELCSGGLSRCAGAPHLPSPAPAQRRVELVDDCMSDRRSLLSIASGIYEEIPDLPEHGLPEHALPEHGLPEHCLPEHDLPEHCLPEHDLPEQLYTKMSRDVDGKCNDSKCNAIKCSVKSNAKCNACSDSECVGTKCGLRKLEEPMYECVSELVGVYATMRRSRRCPPPPLPPRLPFGTMKLGESWNSRMNSGDAVTRHSSLGSLPRCHSVSSSSSSSTDSHKTKTLPKERTRTFSVFRKRLKSDSRIVSPKSETAKENKDVETKKKKFDFTPTRDIFKNFKVSRKMKNLKIAPGGLSKVGETKSCEFLDETEHVTTNRCSKSVECLEGNDGFDEFDLSLEFKDDSIASLALPQEIVDLILRSEQLNKIRLKTQLSEGDYMPMSPICPPPPADHYIVMSPSANRA